MPAPTETDSAVVEHWGRPQLRCKAAKPFGVSSVGVDITDIRRSTVDLDLKEEILAMFNPPSGPRKLPTLLLYDDAGLQIFEDITYLEEYYLTNYEIEVLQRSAADIAAKIPSGSIIVELGSGNLRKVCLLLQALNDAAKQVDYYALDLSLKELERTLAQLPTFDHVRCRGLLGTYEDGREWLKQPAILSRPKCILHLGSSIGNFDRDEAADFLKSFADVLLPNDRMLIGVDACSDPAKVYHAYNDKEGLTHEFVLNGLVHANKILGKEVFRKDDWRVIGEYVYDVEGGRHQAFFSPIRDVRVLGAVIRPHERIQIEQSLKYSQAESDKLWTSAGLLEIGRWTRDQEYGLHMLEKPSMPPFSLIPSVYSGTTLPTVDDWEALWQAWDLVTKGMLPREELLDKPIKLRNACIFYLGHIPTFLDIQLSKTTGRPPTEPSFYYSIFERGIDPDVDNPELCHAHSEIPEEWPAVEEIAAYQARVRSRLMDLYLNGIEEISRKIGRGIWVGFEHEIMHIETLLYMMIQSDKTLPPPNTVRPDFEKLARKAEAARLPAKWHRVPEQTVTIGIDETDEEEDNTVHFGWDNEKPERVARVRAFEAMNRPITNEEYARYLYKNCITGVPASWAEANDGTSEPNTTNGTCYVNGKYSNGHGNGHTNGHANSEFMALPDSFLDGKSVRTVYGLVPLKYALDWPVWASYDELNSCAAYMGGRIPTFEEARSIYSWVENVKKDEAERQLSKTVPAVNGHLINDGVEETPPSPPLSAVTEDPSGELFIDLDGTNVGFHHWHPVPVTSKQRLAGQSEMGGVWEWTSTTLHKYDGFEPMKLYPGYTADFFDGKHNIVLGGSWATHPRIAGRKSFVNWYQRNYPYAWVGARLVRDLAQ